MVFANTCSAIQRECSASADWISSRTVEIALGVPAYPNPGLCGRWVEAGAHAFARGSARSREGVGYTEYAVVDLRRRLDATRVRHRHFYLRMGIRSTQHSECRNEDG